MSKQLWTGSALVCIGIVATGISYLLTDDGRQYTLLWGPMVVGSLIYARAMINGLGGSDEFEGRAALGAAAAPVALAVVFFGIAKVMEPTDAEMLAAGFLPVNRSEIHRLVRAFETSPTPATQCEAAAKLGAVNASDAALAVQTLMKYYGVMPRDVQTCMRDAVLKLDPSVKFPEPNRF